LKSSPVNAALSMGVCKIGMGPFPSWCPCMLFFVVCDYLLTLAYEIRNLKTREDFVPLSTP